MPFNFCFLPRDGDVDGGWADDDDTHTQMNEKRVIT